METERIEIYTAGFSAFSCSILKAGKALRFHARGGSMAPLLRDGDVLWIWPVEPNMVKYGDVVLFSKGANQVVVHRVVRKLNGRSGRCFTVQGDAVATPDGIFTASSVHGRLVTIERAGRMINVDRLVLRVLGWLAASISRWRLVRVRRVGHIFKRIPGLSCYLA